MTELEQAKAGACVCLAEAAVHIAELALSAVGVLRALTGARTWMVRRVKERGVLGVGEQVQQVGEVVVQEVQTRQMSSTKKLWLAAADAEILMVVEPPVLVKL